MQGNQTSKANVFHTRILDIICKTIGVKVGLGKRNKYLIKHIPPYETSSKDVFWVLKARFSILKKIAPYLLQAQAIIVFATVPLHDYITQEAQKDWLFDNYGNKELSVID